MALKSAYNVEKKSLSKAYIERGREIIDLRLTQAGSACALVEYNIND